MSSKKTHEGDEVRQVGRVGGGQNTQGRTTNVKTLAFILSEDGKPVQGFGVEEQRDLTCIEGPSSYSVESRLKGVGSGGKSEAGSLIRK